MGELASLGVERGVWLLRSLVQAGEASGIGTPSA